MGSGKTAATDEVLPPFTPMRAASTRQLPDLDSPAPTTGIVFGEDDKSCVTPTSDRFLLKPTSICPPAPRKPHPLKRKLDLPARGFFVVSRDLTSVFVAISEPPAAKKLKVG